MWAYPVRTGLSHAARGTLRRQAPVPGFANRLRRVSAWSLLLRRRRAAILRAR